MAIKWTRYLARRKLAQASAERAWLVPHEECDRDALLFRLRSVNGSMDMNERCVMLVKD